MIILPAVSVDDLPWNVLKSRGHYTGFGEVAAYFGLNWQCLCILWEPWETSAPRRFRLTIDKKKGERALRLKKLFSSPDDVDYFWACNYAPKFTYQYKYNCLRVWFEMPNKAVSVKNIPGFVQCLAQISPKSFKSSGSLQHEFEKR